MATITSAASGNWSAGATWVGGVAPTSADDVVIASPHVVTQNNTSCVGLTLTVNDGGSLVASTVASNRLTLEQGGTIFGTHTVNMTGSASITSEVVLNNAATSDDRRISYRGSAVVTLSGFVRRRKTTLLTAITTSGGASTTATVANATGWQIGDRIVFGTTQAYNATPRTDEVVLTAVNTGTGVISWTGSAAFAHAIGGHVGNFTSNVVFRTPAQGGRGHVMVDMAYAGTRNAKLYSNVLFQGLYNDNYESYSAFSVKSPGASLSDLMNVTLSDSVFYNNVSRGFALAEMPSPITFSGNIFYSTQMVGNWSAMDTSSTNATGTIYSDFGIFRATGGSDNGGISGTDAGVTFNDGFVAGVSGVGFTYLGTGVNARDVEIYSNNVGIRHNNGTLTATRMNVGTFNAANGSTTTNASADTHGLIVNNTFTDSATQSLSLTSIGGCISDHKLTYINIGADVTKQEVYRPFMSVKRENTTKNRSTSSIAIGPTKLSTACQRTLSIPCAAGASVRVIGYVQKSHASNVAATVSLTGLGSAWGGFTAANNTAWQVWDTGNITNSSGVDGNFTLTYTANSSSGLTNVVYFDGVPDTPFVTKCRHYGFTFDESNPVRAVNPATAVSVEATAIGYTGVTINTVTPQITVGAGTANTFKKLYDYTQAWACQTANLGSTVLLTSTDGNNFALPTTCRLSWPTMGADGTLVGGRLLLAATGTHTYKLSGTVIEFQAVGTYSMGATTFSGTVELVNTSGGAVTVQLPAGTSYTNTGPSITVDVPTVTQGLAFTGLVAGSQVVVYTTGTTTELSRTNSSGTTYTWSRAGGTDATVDYTVMRAGRLPIRVVGVTVNAAVLATPVQQVVDRSYVASSGLTFGTTATVNTGTSRFTLTTATTGQNWYSFMVESWIAQSALRNVQFPLSTNGPNSFTLDGWEFSSGLTLIRQDGIRYLASGVATAIYSALYSVDTAAGLQIRYQQTDGGTTVDASNTGQIDQIIQVYGDATHGNFDLRSWLTLKVQADGYDQAETSAVATYGNLEDQLYVIGLNPVSNGLPTGAPTVAGSPTITDHGASPVTWNSKAFSITITDSAAGNTGETLMRWIRYNLSLGSNFQGKDAFNWHDLVQTNGDSFKSVRGAIYGDTGAAIKGVRVVMSDGTTPHPSFNLFTADDGTTYAPPPSSTITLSGITAGSRVQLYDTANGVELLNSTSVYTYSETYSVDRTLRVRIAYQSGTSAKNFIEANIGSTSPGSPNLTYIAAQTDDTVYNANAIDGSAVTGITISDSIDRMVINIAGGSVSWPQIYAYNVYWLTTSAGIVDDGSIITATDNANYRVTLFKIRNSSTTPLSITGGYGVDSTTGTVSPLIDTAGSTGNIYQTPDHVVAYQTTGTYAITGDISTVLAAVSNVPAGVLSAAAVAPIAANVEQVNAITISGAGTESDPWGP